eukprot:jgi/Undpi1/7071/HiC_scaffold_22.g09545.m1
MNLFGWSSGSESVAKEREAVRARRRREMEEAEAREVLRHGREDRLERELEKEASESEDRLDGGGILEPFVPGGIARHRSSGGADRLWLDAVEGVVGGMVLAMVSLRPLWHTFRGMFGLSLLFYGEEFATLAFHIIVFRLSGWKKAAKSKNELVAYYLKARQAMIKAAKDVRASAALMAKKDRMLARKEEMMAEKKKLLKMGHVTPAEARAFIDKYRRDIEIIAREQEVLATASSSVLAIKGALSLKKLAASVNGLYSAVITSITASTFKRAGQLTLALTCGGLIKKTLFDLLGPVIDPIGYQIELESYVAKIMRGPANLYVGIVGYVGAALMFFHFFVDPHKALMITFVLLGARVVTDYVVAALNPVRWRFGMSKKIDNMPLSAVIYLSVATMGFVFHGDAGVVGDYVCRPFIAFLGILNNLLNRFQISTISYFT